MQITHTIATERQISEWEHAENNDSYLGTLNSIRTIENPDYRCLELALKFLCNRHESLRTSFDFIDGVLMQILYSEIEKIPIFYKTPVIIDDAHISVIVEEFMSTKFNLNEGPLFKVVVLKLNQTLCKVGFIISHIISDASSMQILSDELSLFYEAYKLKIPIQIDSLNFQMKEYAVLEKEVNESAEGIENLAFWENLFSTLTIPDFPSLEVNKHAGLAIENSLPGAMDYCFVPNEILKGLKELCSNQYLVLITSIAIWLSRVFEKEKILLAIPFSARDNPNLNGVVGYLITAMFLKIEINDRLTFREIILNVIGVYAEAISRRHYSRRSITVNTVPFSHAFINNLSNMHVKPDLELSTLKPHFVIDAPHYPIELAISNYKNGWLLRCYYDTGKFNNNFRSVYKNYIGLLKKLIEYPDKAIGTIHDLKLFNVE